jgi:hypothetical protein
MADANACGHAGDGPQAPAIDIRSRAWATAPMWSATNGRFNGLRAQNQGTASCLGAPAEQPSNGLHELGEHLLPPFGLVGVISQNGEFEGGLHPLVSDWARGPISQEIEAGWRPLAACGGRRNLHHAGDLSFSEPAARPVLPAATLGGRFRTGMESPQTAARLMTPTVEQSRWDVAWARFAAQVAR